VNLAPAARKSLPPIQRLRSLQASGGAEECRLHVFWQ
jgi:hypothetical protein